MDQAAFAELVAPLRRELHAHCYRMLGSAFDADDAVQETLLRAWRGFAGFEGRSSVRTWLHTVATRVCLTETKRRRNRVLPVDFGPSSDQAVLDDAPLTDVPWLGPYPEEPGDRVTDRESVELAFVAAPARRHSASSRRTARGDLVPPTLAMCRRC